VIDALEQHVLLTHELVRRLKKGVAVDDDDNNNDDDKSDAFNPQDMLCRLGELYEEAMIGWPRTTPLAPLIEWLSLRLEIVKVEEAKWAIKYRSTGKALPPPAPDSDEVPAAGLDGSTRRLHPKRNREKKNNGRQQLHDEAGGAE
jgi:hypothetical protein